MYQEFIQNISKTLMTKISINQYIQVIKWLAMYHIVEKITEIA